MTNAIRAKRPAVARRVPLNTQRWSQHAPVAFALALRRGAVRCAQPPLVTAAFRSGEGITVMNADGSALWTLVRRDFRPETTKPSDLGVGEAAWSPDGALIAVGHQGDGETQPGQIFVMRSDGSDLHLMPTSVGGVRRAEYHPSWSRNGATVVFWSYDLGIVTVNRNGGVPSTIARGAYGARPALSPDGRILALTTDRYSPTRVSISILTLVSGARLLVPDAYDAAWSPDGKRITFVSAREQ